mgnify:CR=1 FL=1
MSLFSVFDVAGSALNAQTIRLNTTSSNMANANSVSSSTNNLYKARHPVFAPLVKAFSDDPAAEGVRVMGIVESQAPARQEYSPDNPMANAQGYVFMPNVNVIDEMADMISASRSYQANVEIMNSAKQMMMRTLAIGQ